jgi:hypothetical protein
MSHSVLAAVIIPIVVIILLAVWLFMVYQADRHPGQGGRPETGRRAVPPLQSWAGRSAAGAVGK